MVGAGVGGGLFLVTIVIIGKNMQVKNQTLPSATYHLPVVYHLRFAGLFSPFIPGVICIGCESRAEGPQENDNRRVSLLERWGSANFTWLGVPHTFRMRLKISSHNVSGQV